MGALTAEGTIILVECFACGIETSDIFGCDVCSEMFCQGHITVDDDLSQTCMFCIEGPDPT